MILICALRFLRTTDPTFTNWSFFIWMFPKIGVPQNGWFIMENPTRMADFGGKHTGNTHIVLSQSICSFLTPLREDDPKFHWTCICFQTGLFQPSPRSGSLRVLFATFCFKYCFNFHPGNLGKISNLTNIFTWVGSTIISGGVFFETLPGCWW